MKSQALCVLLCLAPAMLAGVTSQPWVDAAALLWPVAMVAALVFAFAARALLDALS